MCELVFIEAVVVHIVKDLVLLDFCRVIMMEMMVAIIASSHGPS